jgi:ubiquinone/menaquinone biosynthesis C-methylase UbiE
MSGQKKAYHYLQTSSAQFPCGVEFLKMVDSTHCFSKTKAIPLQFGVAYLYVLEVRSMY